MNHIFRCRYGLAAATIIGLIGAWAPLRADAHAVFVGAPASVAADTDIALTVSVPHERDDTTYNVGVAIQLPEGWTGSSCPSKPTWTCVIGRESGHDVIRYAKDDGAAPAEDEIFVIDVHTGPTPGTASFPTLQTYNTGETVAWIGEPGTAEPAPSLQVISAAAPPTTIAPAPAPAPSTSLPASPTLAPAPTAVPVPTLASPTTVPATTSGPSTTSTLPTTSTVPTTDSARSTTTSTTLAVAPTATQPTEIESAGSNGGAVPAIAVALLGATAGVVIYLRRRRTLPRES